MVGSFDTREEVVPRDYSGRAFTVGIGGPVGSGKTALVRQLCMALRDELPLAVVTNDIFTREDAEFLTRNDCLPSDRIAAVETGGKSCTAAFDPNGKFLLHARAHSLA